MQYEDLPDMNQHGAPGQPFFDTLNFSRNTQWGTNTSAYPQETRRPQPSNLCDTMPAQTCIPQSPSPAHLNMPAAQDSIVCIYSVFFTPQN
jgi:hypothetical protein